MGLVGVSDSGVKEGSIFRGRGISTKEEDFWPCIWIFDPVQVEKLGKGDLFL